MSLIPRSTARAIDRLARQAHAFHRFAHHPLCPAYAGELVRLGRRTRVCRGCAYTALGGISGAALGVVLPGAPPAVAALAAVGVVVFGASLVLRLPKWVSRLSSSAFGAAAVSAAVASASPFGLSLAAGCALAGLLALLAYRHRGPDRSPCATCPERALATACTGYAPIVRRERAFQRVSLRWLSAARANQ